MMKDDKGRIIYVGKAANIRKRLGSYFRTDKALSPKTRIMMPRVHKIDIITTITEKDALLLEASLIKKHKPRYNIVLRDDKQYVLFKIDLTRSYPAIELVRKAGQDDSLYFGPFTSSNAARQTLKVINKVFLLRKCGHKKFRNRVRPCLQHDIKRCLAPCCLEVDEHEYRKQVDGVNLFLSGRSENLLNKLNADMLKAAQELDFEKAAIIRDQIRALKQTVKSQSVVIPGGDDLDVFDLVQWEKGLCTGIIFVRQGKVLDSKNFFWPEHEISENEDMENVLVSILSQFYNHDSFIPEKIVLPITLHDNSIRQVLSEYRGKNVNIVRATGENMKSLLRMARHNSLQAASRSQKLQGTDLSKIFKTETEIIRIECIDVSHQSGQNTRLGKVVFENGEPLKPDYRIYNLPHVAPGDDYQAMSAFVSARIHKGGPWPDLLLIDGGLGQLNTVLKTLQDNNIEVSFQIAAIAKGPTRSQGQLYDQVFIPGRKNPLPLKPGSPELLFLQKVRDTAHEFAIGSLRRSSSKSLRQSQLENIPGIGPKKAKALWDYFKDLNLILNSSEKELSNVPGFGPQTAQKTFDALQTLKQQPNH